MAAAIEKLKPRDGLWPRLQAEAAEAARAEPALGSLLHAVILSHSDLAAALSFQLARKLGDAELGAMALREVCDAAFRSDPAIVAAGWMST